MTSESKIENLTLDSLTVVLDRANRTWRGPFTYTSDPKILAISPVEAFKRFLNLESDSEYEFYHGFSISAAVVNCSFVVSSSHRS